MTAGRPPRVLVDATSVPADRGGVGRYVDGLLGALGTDAERVDLVVVCQRTDAGALQPDAAAAPRSIPGPAAVAHRPARLAWEQTGLPLLAQQVGAEVLHSPFYTCPLRAGCPVTVTVHDATFFTEPEHYDKSRRTFFRSAIKTSLRRAGPGDRAQQGHPRRADPAARRRPDPHRRGLPRGRPGRRSTRRATRRRPASGPGSASATAATSPSSAPRSRARTCPT